ncbi:hypothetical protein PSE10A_46640 [Pseudomonas amygdali pv. eriobotryae]|uniref:DUF4148 domain-containing protein n=1 Tax=Pseudomonas amygdali pv. eriobotryae TaxID=129137 RepID=A0A9P3EE72_PSEA0|nr:hypothetical protein [Pseudomonas amygdali]GFZ62153.1 hypothetical protein PSE10A_46640 [Pseudomonas amygdali pv. eriobotryae]
MNNNKTSLISALVIFVIGSLTQFAHAESFTYEAPNAYTKQQRNEAMRKAIENIGFVDMNSDSHAYIAQTNSTTKSEPAIETKKENKTENPLTIKF